MPAFLEINDSGEGRLYSILERYDAKFVELADRLTSVTSKLAPMQDTLLLVQQRVTQVVDHMDAMVQKIDADKLSFVHLREYAEEKASEEARTQDLIADLDRLRNTMQERLSKCEAQVAMCQTKSDQNGNLESKVESLRTEISERVTMSFDRIKEAQEDCDKLQRAISWDLERVAAGKVREKKDLAVARIHKPRGAVMRRSDQTDAAGVDATWNLQVHQDLEPEYTQRALSVEDATLVEVPSRDVSWRDSREETSVRWGQVVTHDMSCSSMYSGQRPKPKRSTRSEIHQIVLHNLVRAFSMDEESNIALAAEKANCYELKESVWDASLLLGYSKLGLVSNALLLLGFVINLLLQSLFCNLVLYLPNIGESYTSDGIEAFQRWYDNASDSMRLQVCSQDQSLTNSYHQFAVYDDTDSYTVRVFNMFTFEQGPVLCSVVLFTWFLSMCNAMQEIIVFVVSVLLAHSPSSTSMHMEEVLRNDKNFAITEIPTRRVIWVIGVGAVQLVIAVTLMICGALWLVVSTKNTDLFLNTLALTYIMDIDELVFQAIVPREVHYVITNTEGLQLKNRVGRCSVFRHLPLRSVITLSSMTLTFLMFYFTQLVPLADSVRTVKGTICPQGSM